MTVPVRVTLAVAVLVCGAVFARQQPATSVIEGRIERVAIAPRAGVTSLVLGCGVQVHLRPSEGGVLRMAAVLLGPELVESPRQRGVTGLVAASLDLSRWPLWSCRATPEGLLFSAETSPANLESALAGLRDALAAPVLDAGRFAAAQAASVKERQGSPRESDRAIAEALGRALVPTLDPRARPPSVDTLSAITLADAQAFASERLADLPVDVAIVGPIDVAAALPVIRRTLGSDTRARVRSLHSELRAVERAAPSAASLTGRVPAGGVLMTISLPAPAQGDLRQSRLAFIAAKLLQNELAEAIKAEGLQATLVSTTVMPGRTWPDLGVTVGTLLVTMPGDGESVTRLDRIVRDRISQVHLRGTRVEAFVRARQEAVDELTPRVKRDDYWLSALPVSWFLNVPIDELGTAPETLSAFRSTDLTEHLTKWWGAERLTTLIIRPEVPAPMTP